jgi:hypothetical protein
VLREAGRLLLERGRTVVDRLYPFTIRLKDCVGAIAAQTPATAHRGSITEESCKARLSLHRVDTCISWRKRLHRLAPVSALSVERVQIDMQLLENPEISGVEYQQATLAGYESGNTFSRNSNRTVPICGITDVPAEPRPHPSALAWQVEPV